MDALIECGSCRHMKTFLDHPKYGVIEVDYKKNFELMSKLINEVFEQSHDMPYAVCVIGYLDKARRIDTRPHLRPLFPSSLPGIRSASRSALLASLPRGKVQPSHLTVHPSFDVSPEITQSCGTTSPVVRVSSRP